MNTPSDIPNSQEVAVNKVMETITSTHDSLTDRKQPLPETSHDEDLLSLFNKYSNLLSSNLDWVATEDPVIINEVSVECLSARYHITVQQHATTALFNTSVNMSVIS